MKRILHFLRQFVLSDDFACDLSEVIVFIDLERDGDVTLELYCDSTEQLAFSCRLKRLLGLELVPLGVAISVYLSLLLVLCGLRLLRLSGGLGLLCLARLVALAIVLLVVELLGAILVIVVLAISIVRVGAALTEAPPALAALIVRVLLLLIGLLVAVPLLARVQRLIVRLALVLTVVLLPAAASLVAGVVVRARLLLAGPARLLLVLTVRHFIIIICHIVSRWVLGLLAVVI